MERRVGTVSRGIRCPIISEGDDLVNIVVRSVLEASSNHDFVLNDRDVIGITESVVARSQGNYATIDHIAADIKEKFADKTIGVVFPILSRNRFSTCLEGIAKAASKIVLMLSYPSDEVGNALLDIELMDKSGINPYVDVLSLEKYRQTFGSYKHPFTGLDYVQYYEELIKKYDCEVEIIFANNPKAILNYTSDILVSDIHTRQHTKKVLKEAGARTVVGLDEILVKSIDGSGYNEKYGLLGSNKATEQSIKLFPKDCQCIVEEIQNKIKEETGKLVEVLIYGDGAFKDPVGKIWELADPVVSPAYTSGLKGTPNEIKLKYLADNDFKDLKGEALIEAISSRLLDKDEQLNEENTLGTTPRQLVDLLGSLCDLTSGSGDKGTPVVLVQGYFDSYIG